MTINLGPPSTGDVQPFFQPGGFNLAICNTEDDDSCQRFAFWIELVNTAIVCLCCRQCWNPSSKYLRPPQDTSFSRDNVLDELGCFLRYNSLFKFRLLVWMCLPGILEYSELKYLTTEIIDCAAESFVQRDCIS
jgi:hypothetical protein